MNAYLPQGRGFAWILDHIVAFPEPVATDLKFQMFRNLPEKYSQLDAQIQNSRKPSPTLRGEVVGLVHADAALFASDAQFSHETNMNMCFVNILASLFVNIMYVCTCDSFPEMFSATSTFGLEARNHLCRKNRTFIFNYFAFNAKVRSRNSFSRPRFKRMFWRGRAVHSKWKVCWEGNVPNKLGPSVVVQQPASVEIGADI